MARSFEVRLPLEQAYVREVMLRARAARRGHAGARHRWRESEAVGLTGAPFLNHGGLLRVAEGAHRQFSEDRSSIRRRGRSSPRKFRRRSCNSRCTPSSSSRSANYPFAPGITAIRGSLYETRVPLGQAPVPIPGATIRLEWKDGGNNFSLERQIARPTLRATSCPSCASRRRKTRSSTTTYFRSVCSPRAPAVLRNHRI